MGEMNPFARRFADALFAKFPEWRVFATVDPADAPIPGALAVEIPSPRADAKRLHIETDVDELTISFDMWHSHFGAFMGTLEGESLAEAVGFLDQFVGEECAVAVTMRDGAWAGSQLVYRGDTVRVPAPGVRIRITSWAGSLDAELESNAAAELVVGADAPSNST